MRLTGGSLRGRTIPGRVQKGVRPTSAKVREALFSMIGHDLTGLTVLDAFGGSGLLGLESYSRGAAVLISEKNPAIARQIRRAVQQLGADVSVRCADAAVVLDPDQQWDIVLLDPPYVFPAEEWARRAAPCARQWLVVEHASTQSPAESIADLTLDRRRRYGDTTLSLYRRAHGG